MARFSAVPLCVYFYVHFWLFSVSCSMSFFAMHWLYWQPQAAFRPPNVRQAREEMRRWWRPLVTWLKLNCPLTSHTGHFTQDFQQNSNCGFIVHLMCNFTCRLYSIHLTWPRYSGVVYRSNWVRSATSRRCGKSPRWVGAWDLVVAVWNSLQSHCFSPCVLKHVRTLQFHPLAQLQLLDSSYVIVMILLISVITECLWETRYFF